MRIPLSALFIALLIWDFFTAKPGQSAIERSTSAIAQSHFFKSFLESVEAKSEQAHSDTASAQVSVAKKSSEQIEGLNTASKPTASAANSPPAQSQPVLLGAMAPPATPLDQARQAGEERAIGRATYARQEAERIMEYMAARQESSERQDLDAQQLSAARAAPKLESAVAQSSGPDDASPKPQHSALVAATIAAGRQAKVSDGYLVHLALVEGGLREQASASTSTAAGPFQFIDQTWLAMVSKYGDDCGLADLAKYIRERSGVYYVKNAQTRRRILALRQDPYVSSFLAAKLTKENAEILQQALKREPLEGDLYVAHILGASDAVSLITTTAATPGRLAATMFPAAAKANHMLFYKVSGDPRSVSELYAYLTRYPSPKLLDLYRERGYVTAVAARAS